MIFLRPDGKIDLEHRAYFLRGNPSGPAVVTADKEGHFSILTSGLEKSEERILPGAIRAVSPHPLDRRLAWVDVASGSVRVQDSGGILLLEIAPPQVKGSFDDCFFDEDGCYLWTAAPLNGGKLVVQLHEAKTGDTIHKEFVKDPFGGSSCSFHRTGKPGLVSLWLAAGNPDMVQVYWLQRTRSGFTCTLEPHLTNTIPPTFAPSGDRLLVVNANNALCQFDFSTMQQIGLSLESGDEDNPFTESLCFVNERQAIVSTNEGRIFAIDTELMKVEDEVAIEDHEPRPIKEYFPTLVNHPGVGSDISYFERLGRTIFFVYRRDRGKGLAGWKDTLLWMSVPP